MILAAPAALAVAATAASADRHAKVTATFATPALYKTHPAVTYDQQNVPKGSWVQIVEQPQDKPGDAGNVTLETLRVRGLTPNRMYDAYLYTRRRGAAPAAAGRRTQDGPSRDHYQQNEVWLDFKTAALARRPPTPASTGASTSASPARRTQSWSFRMPRRRRWRASRCGSPDTTPTRHAAHLPHPRFPVSQQPFPPGTTAQTSRL